MAETINSIYTGMKTPRDITKYALMRGVTDFSNLAQFNLYESGYPFLILINIPKFMEQLAASNTEYANLINVYKHVLEYEFRGLDGIDNMTASTGEITNGISTLEIINKVEWQSNTKFSMRYFEKSGSLITKVHELYLRGIKDPRTQVKTYNGLLRPGANGSTAVMSEAGYEYETYSFLYFVTDNTLLNIEKAVLLVSCQPSTAELNIYNGEKGQIEFKEITTEFNGYPITGPAVTAKAKEFLDWINNNTTFEDAKYAYNALNNIPSPTASTNAVTTTG
jgi:hypothetical protein